MYSIGNNLYSGKTSLDIIGRRKIWFAIALVFIIASLGSFFIKTPNLGIEFRGGSQFMISGTEIESQQPAFDAVADLGKDDAPRVSNVGMSGLRVQTVELNNQETQDLREALAQAYGVPESNVTSTFIGPSWGADVMSKAIRAMIVFMVLVSVVLIVYFRMWTIAVGAVGALLHDFVVTLGAYWLLGLEITPATIIGILTIMGYSLYDTVVVFDKVRENTAELRSQTRHTFAESANLAVNQTLIRSLNTSITGLLPVIAVLVIGVGILGADTLRDLALVMFIGMLLSTISSIFIATPLAVALVALGERNPQVKEHTERVLELREADAKREASNDMDATDTEEWESVMVARSGVDEREAGHHLGVHAQPKRKQRSKRVEH